MDNYENFEEFFGKKKGKSKIGEKLKNAINKVKDKGKDAALVPLLPFKGAMKKALKKRGVKHGKSLRDIAEKFYLNVIKQGQNFESVDPVTLGIIVPAIVDFFKNLLDKAKTGKASTEDKDLLDTAEKELKSFNPDTAIQQEEKDENSDASSTGSSGSGSESSDNKMMILLALVAALFFLKK